MSRARAPLVGAPPLIRYGNPQLVIGASPAAGAHFSFDIPGNYYTRLISVFCRLVTDANVADRTVLVEYRGDDAQRFALSGGSLTQAASLTRDWAFNVFQPASVSGLDSTFLAPLAPIMLTPGMDFRIFIANGQATDQLSRIRLVLEQFYTDDEGAREAAEYLAGLGN
jgi:hypothetical protein